MDTLPKYKFEKIKKHIRINTPTGIYVYLNNIYKDDQALDVKTLNSYLKMYSTEKQYSNLSKVFKEDIKILLEGYEADKLPFIKDKKLLKKALISGDDDSVKNFSGFVMKKSESVKSSSSDEVGVVYEVMDNIGLEQSINIGNGEISL